MKKYFSYKNINPIKNETSDCVIRALALTLDKSWDEIYKELAKIGFELKVDMSADESWRKLMDNHGWIKNKISNAKGTKRPTVKEFAKNHKEGRYLLQVANHLTTVVDGVCYDIWDCSDKCLYAWYSKS